MDVNTNPSTLQPFSKALSIADNLNNTMDKLYNELNKSKTNQSESKTSETNQSVSSDAKTNPNDSNSKSKSKSKSNSNTTSATDIPASIKRRIGLLNGIAYHLTSKKQIKIFKMWLDELIVNTQLLANNEIDTETSDDNE
jgi:hypothetical protein